jgi:hypothetical protein
MSENKPNLHEGVPVEIVLSEVANPGKPKAPKLPRDPSQPPEPSVESGSELSEEDLLLFQFAGC